MLFIDLFAHFQNYQWLLMFDCCCVLKLFNVAFLFIYKYSIIITQVTGLLLLLLLFFSMTIVSTSTRRIKNRDESIHLEIEWKEKCIEMLCVDFNAGRLTIRLCRTYAFIYSIYAYALKMEAFKIEFELNLGQVKLNNTLSDTNAHLKPTFYL